MCVIVRADWKAMTSLVRGVFDRRVADPRRISTTVAAIVGATVMAGAATSNRRLRALCYGLASAAGAGIPLRMMLDQDREARQEARDLWGLGHVMVDGRPWPAPGGWALGANAIGWLLREMHSRGSRVVVELGPGTSSVVLASSAGSDLEMTGIEHDLRYVESLEKQLTLNGLSGYKLVHVPLAPRAHDRRTVQWYDISILKALPTQIDVLIVDGPPNWKGEGNRAPALDTLDERLLDGAVVLVDDTHRPDERNMVNSWIEAGRLRLLHDGDTFMGLEVTRDKTNIGDRNRSQVSAA
jgi:hypothetical protein